MERRRNASDALPEDLRRRLRECHRGLLRLHKVLLDHERGRYERDRGRINNSGEFLQLVINDPWFAWLHLLSELAVMIDEILTSKEAVEPQAGEAILVKARELVVPVENGTDFQREYYRATQESPEIAVAHGEWKIAIGGAVLGH